jgi:hypothetical protein
VLDTLYYNPHLDLIYLITHCQNGYVSILTEQDNVDEIPGTAEIGQLVKMKTIDSCLLRGVLIFIGDL